MKLRTGRGRLELVLQTHEVELMRSLLEEMTSLFDEDAPLDADDPVLQRLFPDAYNDDPGAAEQYRDMTQNWLRGERLERVTACAGDLDAAGGAIDLRDPDVSRRWIQVLNDLRLALGTRLGVTEESEPDLDPTSPEAQPWLIYGWLTAVQDSVVTALMR